MIVSKFKSALNKLADFILTIDDYNNFRRASWNDDVETMDAIFSKKKIRLFQIPTTEIFNDVCRIGNLNAIQYLLTSPNTKMFHNVHVNDTKWIEQCCEFGYSDILQYLFTSPELNAHPDMHSGNEMALRVSCKFMRFDIIDFLLRSEKFQEKANLHFDNDILFKSVVGNQHIEILQYLIFDSNIEKTEEINSYINQIKVKPHFPISAMYHINIPSDFIENIERMFQLRELNGQLEKELTKNKTPTRKVKL